MNATRGKRWSIRQERAALDEGFEKLRLVPRPEFEDRIRELRGVAFLDQLQAASAETETRLQALLGVPPYVAHLECESWPTLVKLHAGVIRCIAQSSCDHAAAIGGHPLTAILVARVIACERCLPRFRGAIIAALRRNASGADRVCDYCLADQPLGVSFRAVATHFGPVTVVGDVCDTCWGEINEDKRAA